MLIMAASGGGKDLHGDAVPPNDGKTEPLISILERGDSYRPLVELMGGRWGIDVDLEGSITLNPWDLAPGTTTPGRTRSLFSRTSPAT